MSGPERLSRKEPSREPIAPSRARGDRDRGGALADAIGNRALLGLLRAARPAGVPVASPGSAGERRADAVADAVQPGAAGGERASGEPPVSVAPEPLLRAATTGGSPLPDGVRGEMESRMDARLEDVRVHTGPAAAAASAALGARAFTFGKHVVFGDGEYRPESAAGRRLLAHELAHAVGQDGAGGVVHAWHVHARSRENDDAGHIDCFAAVPLAAFRGNIGTDRYVAHVHYFCPLNIAPFVGVSEDYWVDISVPHGTSAGTVRMGIGAAHATAWHSTRFVYPSNNPSRSADGCVGWFENIFEREIAALAATLGGGASVSTSAPAGSPCP